MKNPYLLALTVITVCLFVIAGIIYIVAVSTTGDYGTSDPEKQLPILVAAGTWLGFGAVSLLATLLLGGVIWNSEAARISQVAHEAKKDL